jgi:hypothetical protein
MNSLVLVLVISALVTIFCLVAAVTLGIVMRSSESAKRLMAVTRAPRRCVCPRRRPLPGTVLSISC